MRLPVMQLPSAPADQFTPSEAGPRSISAVKMLRISVTDRCNFRCLYCMPADGVKWLDHGHILRYEEIRDVVRAAIEIHGIRRFKLTGGEPTVRRDLVDLVSMLRRLDGIEELSLTTNGQRLVDLAYPLRDAGLDRITISLDSLRPERFKEITRTGDLALVMRGIEACELAGFNGLKINCVAMRGINDDEFADFARLTLRRSLTVRFIEYMPLGDSQLGHLDGINLRSIARDEIGPAGGCGAQDRGQDSFISEAQIRDLIERELGALAPVDRRTEPGVGPANVYRLAEHNAAGRIGFISAMSAPFCSTCNRLRLTAHGLLRSCLFEGGEVDVRSILRGPGERADIARSLAKAMVDCVRLRPVVHSEHGNQQMSRLGG